MTMNIQLERARVLAVSCVDVNRSVGPSLRHRSWLAVRHAIICSLSIGLIAGVLGGAWASPSFAATTSKDKSLFVTVASSYNAAVTEFNVVIDSFPACSSPTCVSDAIEGAGDTSFYKATLALEKKGPYPSGVSKDVIEYVGTIVNIQKDVNAIAKAKTIAQQKQLVSTKLEIDVENLAFRGMQILIYLGEQKSY